MGGLWHCFIHIIPIRNMSSVWCLLIIAYIYIYMYIYIYAINHLTETIECGSTYLSLRSMWMAQPVLTRWNARRAFHGEAMGLLRWLRDLQGPGGLHMGNKNRNPKCGDVNELDVFFDIGIIYIHGWCFLFLYRQVFGGEGFRLFFSGDKLGISQHWPAI